MNTVVNGHFNNGVEQMLQHSINNSEFSISVGDYIGFPRN